MARVDRRARRGPRRRRRGRPLALLPMEVRPGDRFTDEEATWEVVTHPAAFRDGKACEAMVRDTGASGREKFVTWPAHEKLAITRPAR